MLEAELECLGASARRLGRALRHPLEDVPHVVLLEPTELAPAWWRPKTMGRYPNRRTAVERALEGHAHLSSIADFREGRYRCAVRPAP